MQRELFEEFEAPKKKRLPSASILPKNYLRFNVSYEQLIFIAIAVIMLMVLVFSLGVEKGRHVVESGPVKERTVIKVETPVVAAAISEPAKAPVKAEKPYKEIKKLYTVQVIAYRSKKLAQKELVKLTKKGYKPFIIVGGGYYQICVGEYEESKEAKEELAKLKKTYKDSFVRKR